MLLANHNISRLFFFFFFQKELANVKFSITLVSSLHLSLLTLKVSGFYFLIFFFFLVLFWFCGLFLAAELKLWGITYITKIRFECFSLVQSYCSTCKGLLPLTLQPTFGSHQPQILGVLGFFCFLSFFEGLFICFFSKFDSVPTCSWR